MITRIGFAPRRADLSVPDFLDHWRTAHADAAARIPGLASYVQLHPVLDGNVPVLGYPGFDACSELDFPSLEVMDAGFASPAYQQDVVADEAVLIDKSRFGLVLAEREVIAGQRGDGGGVRLVTFLRRHPDVAADTLFEAVTGPYAAAVADAVVGHELLRSLDVDRPGRERRAFDGVDTLVFEDVEAARRWLGSDAAADALRSLAGLTAGTARLLAEARVIV